MKTFTLFILAISTSVNICFGETQILDIINKIMAMPVISQILSDKAMDRAVDSCIETVTKYQQPNFRPIYFDARQSVYEDTIISTIMHENVDRAYNTARTLIVAKTKEHLHKDQNLAGLYTAFREKIQQKLSLMSTEDRAKLKTYIATARATFLDMKQPDTLTHYKELLETEEKFRRADYLYLLGKNLTAEETARAISSGSLISYREMEAAEVKFYATFTDRDLASFAGRRALEGGDKLLDQYLLVLKMMAEDVK